MSLEVENPEAEGKKGIASPRCNKWKKRRCSESWMPRYTVTVWIGIAEGGARTYVKLELIKKWSQVSCLTRDLEVVSCNKSHT